MDLRKRAKHRRDPLPVGTVRIRRRKRATTGACAVRFIKVRNSGPPQARWKPLARHWWETHRGPVPDGLRVCHLNGDTLDDRPENYGLLAAGDVAFLWHDAHPDGSAANYAKCRGATAAYNRERAALRRALTWLPSRWYPVDHSRRVILNRPARKCWQIFDRPVPGNGAGWHGWALGWPALNVTCAVILAVLSDRCDRRGDALRRDVEAFRRLRGWTPYALTPGRLHSLAVELKRDGLLHVLRTGTARRAYRITAHALTIRAAVSPWLPVRGRDLLTDAYAHFQREEPAP